MGRASERQIEQSQQSHNVDDWECQWQEWNTHQEDIDALEIQAEMEQHRQGTAEYGEIYHA